MLARLVPTKTVHAGYHLANNRPFFVKISTGCSYYAAVRAQEVYECIRNTGWFTGGALAAGMIGAGVPLLAGASLVAVGLGSFLSMAATGLVAGRTLYPTRAIRDRRELMGQAIETAAVKLVYNADPRSVELNLFRNAASIARPNSSYQRKGMFAELRGLPWESMSMYHYRRGDEVPARIGLAMQMLRECQQEAEEWVERHRPLLMKWRYTAGADSSSDQYYISDWSRG